MARLPFQVLVGCAFALIGKPSPASEAGLDVLISADAIDSPEGFRPKSGKTIPYLLILSRETLGEVIAGVQLPAAPVVQRALIAELEKQGFVRAIDGAPDPAIAIFAVVGDSNFKDEIPPGNPWNDDRLRVYLEAVNLRQIYSQLGLFASGPMPSVGDIFNHGDEPMRPSDLRDAIVNEARRLRNREPARNEPRLKSSWAPTRSNVRSGSAG
jgi:hypothetical protein